MASVFSVFTAFKAIDKVTKTFRNMGKGADRFGRKAEKSFRNATKGASRFRDVTKGILAAGAISRGLGILSRGIGSVTRQFIDFDQATIGAAARFKDIGPSAVDFEKQLGKIRDRAREAGAATEFTAAQSAEALNFLAKAGFTSAEAMGSLNSMINLATATGEDFDRVADISSDLLGAFGLNVDDTAQKIKNLARINDIFSKATNTANVDMEDLFETLKDVAPVAILAGQSVESVTAVTAFLGGAGIKGSKAGTALKNAFLNLATPSKKASGMLRELGVNVDDGTGNMRDLNDIIADLAPELDKMGNIKAQQVLDEIFGKRAIAGAANIAGGTEAIRGFEKALLDADGTAAATAERMRQSIGNRLKALGSSASEFGFKIVEAFEVKGEGAIDKLTKAIRGFNVQPIIIAIGTTIDIFKTLIAIISPFKEVIAGMTAAWIVYATVMKLVAAAQAIVLLTNPVTLLIASLILLTAFIINWWDEIKLGWKIMFNFIADTADSWARKFLTFFGSVIKTILSGIGSVVGFFGGDTAAFDRVIQEVNDFQANVNANIEGGSAPNQLEAEARQSNINFQGQINIAGAPAGTTTESETRGAPDIDFGLLGG